MSSATKKTKAAKSTTRKEPARPTAAEKKTAKKTASKPSAAKTARPKTIRAKTAKPKATKTTTARPKTTKTTTARPKTTKATTARPKTTKTKTARQSEASSAVAVANAPTPVPETQPKREAPRKRARSRKSRTTQVHAPAAEVLPQRTPGVPPPSSRLGTKWECFSCGAKFYDLNKPEPLCPKCAANQLERPKVAREVKPRVVPRTSRAMAPLLDEDEDAMVAKKEELDLGLAGIDEAVTKFIDADEPDDEAVEDEEEEL